MDRDGYLGRRSLKVVTVRGLGRLVRVLSLVLMAVFLSSCSSDAVYLPALLADPMAEYSHPDLRVVSRTEQGKGEGLLGKTVEPAVHSRYAIRAGGDWDVVFNDAVEAASRLGWQFESDEPGLDRPGVRAWLGFKELPEGLAAISIGLGATTDEPRTFSIRLEFAEEY